MKRLIYTIVLVFFASSSRAGTDGEVAWTKLSFCNGSGYCIEVESSGGTGISSLKMAHNGSEVVIPKSAIAIGEADAPLLNEVRLLSVQRSNGAFGNTLEIPYLRLAGGKSMRMVLKLHFDESDSFQTN